jgi:single-stranded DNA-binding protein
VTTYATPLKIDSIVGLVGSDPELRETAKGIYVRLSLSVTTAAKSQGEQYSPSEWWDVLIKDPGLQKTVLSEVYKGARVVAEGNPQVGEYNGKAQRAMWASRIGLVEWLRRDQAPAPAAVSAAQDELGF